jgi:small subunit ribosomal protein S1
MTDKINPNKISNSDYEELIKKTISFEQTKEKSIVDGRVVSIDKDNVVIDVGLKSEGRIHLSEFTRPGQKPEIKIGDKFKVYIDKLDGKNGETKLSREKAIKQDSWNKLQDSFANGEAVVGIPVNKVKGGLMVDLDGVIAFLPGSQIESRTNLKDINSLLNKSLSLIILKMDKFRGNIVVSRKAISDKENKEKREILLSNLKEGSVIKGTIKNLTDYGAFIDLGGIDGLVHVTDISWKKINHPSDDLVLNSEIDVKVLKYDEKNSRISLGIKQLTDDPWEKVEQDFKVDEKYTGKVISINDQGVSLNLDNNFYGFVSIQDLSWLKKPPHPSKLIQNDQLIDIKLLEINHEKRRLICGVKQLKENPWENILSNFTIGDTLDTEIVNKVDFGIFVKIYDEIDGMVHVSDLSWDESESIELLNSLNKNDKIKVRILDIDKQKERVSLGVKHLTNDPVNDYIKKYPTKSIVTGEIISTDDKGIIVKLSKNVNGFIKKSNLSKDKSEQKIERFAKHEKIDSMIISFDKKSRKINLSLKEKEAYEDQKTLSQYGSSDSGASLGDILGDAFNKKKSD